MNLLPVSLKYKIMTYTPCFDLTDIILKNHRYRIKCLNQIQRYRITLDEYKSIYYNMQNFNFLDNNEFIYFSDRLFISIYYKDNRKYPEYILLFT